MSCLGLRPKRVLILTRHLRYRHQLHSRWDLTRAKEALGLFGQCLLGALGPSLGAYGNCCTPTTWTQSCHSALRVLIRPTSAKSHLLHPPARSKRQSGMLQNNIEGFLASLIDTSYIGFGSSTSSSVHSIIIRTSRIPRHPSLSTCTVLSNSEFMRSEIPK